MKAKSLRESFFKKCAWNQILCVKISSKNPYVKSQRLYVKKKWKIPCVRAENRAWKKMKKKFQFFRPYHTFPFWQCSILEFKQFSASYAPIEMLWSIQVYYWDLKHEKGVNTIYFGTSRNYSSKWINIKVES